METGRAGRDRPAREIHLTSRVRHALRHVDVDVREAFRLSAERLHDEVKEFVRTGSYISNATVARQGHSKTYGECRFIVDKRQFFITFIYDRKLKLLYIHNFGDVAEARRKDLEQKRRILLERERESRRD